MSTRPRHLLTDTIPLQHAAPRKNNGDPK